MRVAREGREGDSTVQQPNITSFARKNSWGRARGCTHEGDLFPGQGTVVAIALGGGAGEGARPIGANLPHRCTAFRVGYRRGASSVEPPCRFWWTRSIPRLTRAGDRGGHRPGGWGPGRGRAPSPQAAELCRALLVAPTPPGHDELLVRTGRTLAECPPTRIQTVFRGGGRLTADWPIVLQNSLRLLNWAVSSWISIPNVNAYGGEPPPRTTQTRGMVEQSSGASRSPTRRGLRGKFRKMVQ